MSLKGCAWVALIWPVALVTAGSAWWTAGM
jgi:hypothetical protein